MDVKSKQDKNFYMYHQSLTGYHLWRTDLRPEDTPLESGLGFVCKLKKDTPFLGRGAVEKQKADGIKQKRACFTIDE